MVDNIKWVLKDDIFLAYETELGEGQIRFSDITPYWDYATAEDIEGCNRWVYGDSIIILMLVASRQGGIIVGWNTKTEKVEHISEADYALTLDVYDGDLYSLILVECYGRSPKAFIEKTRYGYIKPMVEKLEDVDIKVFDAFDGNLDNVKLSVSDTGVKVIINSDDEFVIQDNNSKE